MTRSRHFSSAASTFAGYEFVPENYLPIQIDWRTGALSGERVVCSIKKLSQLKRLFLHPEIAAGMDPETLVYRVEYWLPVAEGTTGGLFWGTTVIEPGKVGDEFFMTHGHFHAVRDRAEFYATIRGEGALILMGEDGRTRFEPMRPGSLHYIPGSTAHRVANTGSEPLVFAGCWPSDAGHDYTAIQKTGFSARLLDVEGQPTLVSDGVHGRTEA